METPLTSLIGLWFEKIEKAKETKRKQFGDTADECWRFFDSSHEWMYEYESYSEGDDFSLNTEQDFNFRMTLNKVSELVQLFGPVMYHKNPHRQVSARKPQISPTAYQLLLGQQAEGAMQQVQQSSAFDEARSELMQWYLNYLPNELHLKDHSRLAIDEALIKGRGVVWHSVVMPEGSDVLLPETVFESVDTLFIDPDATGLRDAKWIARKRRRPKHLVSRDWGVPEDDLKGVGESTDRAAAVRTSEDGEYHRGGGHTHDMVEYWEIWSKTGIGQHFKGGGLEHPSERLKDVAEIFGDYCYLVIAKGTEYPLNIPPQVMKELDVSTEEGMEQLLARVRWPIPFWADNGAGRGWPCSVLDFHPMPNQAWPQAHMKPALGELKFLNFAFSFMMNRIHASCRTLIFVADHVDEEFKDAVTKGGDMEIVPFKTNVNKTVKEALEVVQFPPVNTDIWNIIAAVMELFEKRVGLNELLYGLAGQTQIRTASEANIRREQVSVRPDDMAEIVEEWQSTIARREAQIARWFVDGRNAAPTFGERHRPEENQFSIHGGMWDQLVSIPLDYANPETISRVVREFEYRIEAGSVRKPNRERDVANLDQSMQVIMPLLQVYYQQSGDVEPVNALMAQWCKVRDVDPGPFMLKPPPPPDPQQMAAQASSEAVSEILPVLQDYLFKSGDPTALNGLLADWAQSRNMDPQKYQVQPLMPPPESTESEVVKIEREGSQRIAHQQLKGRQDMELAALKGRIDLLKTNQILKGRSNGTERRAKTRLSASHS